MRYTHVYSTSIPAPLYDGTPVMAISYRQQTAIASIDKRRKVSPTLTARAVRHILTLLFRLSAGSLPVCARQC